MSTAKERLSHLLALAAEGPRQRAALAGELAELLFDWPLDCPVAMRAPVEALFECTVREADDATRARLAARLGGHPELPLLLVNEFYLFAPPRVRREILLRNELEDGGGLDDAPPDGDALIAAARQAGDFTGALADAAGVPRTIAERVVADVSGEALAVLCKGARVGRAAFSAVMLLKIGGPLDAFDGVPQHAAERLLRHWRTMHVAQAAAAE
jgi:hypothetical protein